MTKSLNEVMEFDHVIEVHPDGSITDRNDLYAPTIFDGEFDGADKWTLLDGYSGQYGYSGPHMHDSESIGGRMERDIRERPGVYVAIVCSWPNDDPEFADVEPSILEGWAVARLND